MIKNNTILKISDNSGAINAKCIKILGGNKKKYGKIGDKIVVSITKTRLYHMKNKLNKVKQKDIVKGIIIKTKKNFFIKSGIRYKFKTNYIVLIDKINNPIGTRIFGNFLKKLKYKLNKFNTITNNFI